MRFIQKFCIIRNQTTIIFIGLFLCFFACVHRDDSNIQDKVKYSTLAELRDAGLAKNTLCIKLISADGEPLPKILILISFENVIDGIGGETNNEGEICFFQLPNCKGITRTRMIGVPQVQKEFILNDDIAHNITLVSILTYLEFKRLNPTHI